MRGNADGNNETMSEHNLNDITVIDDEEDGVSIESDGNDFEAAMKVRKNLSETFDRYASVAEKIARLESKNSSLPPHHDPIEGSMLSVSLRIRPPFAGHVKSTCDNGDTSAVGTTIEILPSSGGHPTTIRTHPPLKSNAAKSVRDSQNSGGIKEYTFQRVFSPETKQDELYSAIAAPMVSGLFPSATNGGESALLFSYGVTNAGKTFTIMGNANPNEQTHWGIIPRAIQDIMGRIKGTNLQFTMSYMEIYNENIYDLLHDSSNSRAYPFKSLSLKLRESPDGDIFVKDLVKHKVQNLSEGLELVRGAMTRRQTFSNNINSSSSRSHCICQMELSTTPEESATDADDKPGKSVKFWVVDLAGSERTKRTGGARQKEATLINTSLMTLMRCLSVMRENQGSSKGVVPFRESKLTHLFMNHLTGQSASRTSMIVNVNPAECDFDETQHVLGYAVSARNVLISAAPIKRSTMDHYEMNGHKKQSKISRLVNKFSPKVLGKRKATENKTDRDIKRVASKPPPVSIKYETALLRGTHTNLTSEDALRKEIISLKASLSIAEAEISNLRLTCDEHAQELANLEEAVRAEVSSEMEQHFQSTREEYDRIIENLQNQVKSNPVGARSERKAKMDKAEKMIEELADKVEECEEEMVRMRAEHNSAIERLLTEHEKILKTKSDDLVHTAATHAAEISTKNEEIRRLKEEHEAEIRDLQARKDESDAFYQEQISKLEGMYAESENEKQRGSSNHHPRSLTKFIPSDSVLKSASTSSTENAPRAPFGAIQENSDDDENLIFPKKPPPIVDGAFSRPSGRAPRGREWDMHRGAWRLSVSSSFGQ